MTTIVYKDGILASDSRASVGAKVFTDDFPKIFDVSDKDYICCGHRVLAYALAGMVSSRLVLDLVLSEGLAVGTQIDSDDDFEAIVVTEGGAYCLSKIDESQSIRVMEIPPNVPWAIGSGAAVANYVMYRGGDAVKAVVEACTVDPFSGGDVITWIGADYEAQG